MLKYGSGLKGKTKTSCGLPRGMGKWYQGESSPKQWRGACVYGKHVSLWDQRWRKHHSRFYFIDYKLLCSVIYKTKLFIFLRTWITNLYGLFGPDILVYRNVCTRPCHIFTTVLPFTLEDNSWLTEELGILSWTYTTFWKMKVPKPYSIKIGAYIHKHFQRH